MGRIEVLAKFNDIDGKIKGQTWYSRGKSFGRRIDKRTKVNIAFKLICTDKLTYNAFKLRKG
jgi:hypothetical protein